MQNMFRARDTRGVPTTATALPPHNEPPRYETSPNIVSSEESRSHKKSYSSTSSTTNEKPSLDITQRFERKLAEYNASNNVFKRWLFEISSWLLSASCMAAIVMIYIHVKNEPMSRFRWALMCTNVLGKLSSAALIVPTSEAIGQLKWNWFHESKAMWDFEIFDKASRGAWGAVMLLFRTKGRSLAALGALLMLLLLAIDSFFQHVVDLPDRWLLQTRAAIAPQAVIYDPQNLMQYLEGMEQAIGDAQLRLTIEEFAYGNGTPSVTFGAEARPDISISCPTSNCTWPPYDTLGVCSRCTDISSEITFACLTHTVDWKADVDGTFNLERPYKNDTGCGYFLNATSEAPILLSGYLVDPMDSSPGEALIMRILPLTTATQKWPLYGNGSIHFKHLRQTIADVLVVSASDGTAETVYRNETPVAQECVLSWCVQTIQSSYNWGRYNEEIVSRKFNTTPGPFPWSSFPYEDDAGNGTDIFYNENITIESNLPNNHQKSIIYGMSNITASIVVQSFVDIFPAYTTVKRNSSKQIFRFKTWKTGRAWTLDLKFNPWLAPNNVTGHMERLATALTNVVRSAASRQDVQGMAYAKEVFISVRWQWLIFPLLLLLLTLAFLVSTIIKTSKDSSTGFWKTSAMPAVIYGLPEETRDQLAASSSMWSSGATARKVRIRLSSNMGWKVAGQPLQISSPRLPPPAATTAPRGWI